jgi:hypothetical protein
VLPVLMALLAKKEIVVILLMLMNQVINLPR